MSGAAAAAGGISRVGSRGGTTRSAAQRRPPDSLIPCSDDSMRHCMKTVTLRIGTAKNYQYRQELLCDREVLFAESRRCTCRSRLALPYLLSFATSHFTSSISWSGPPADSTCNRYLP